MFSTSHTAQAAGDNLKLAISAIVFTVFALSLGDALIKKISAEFPLWQIFVVRSMVAIPVLIAVIKTKYQSVSLVPLNLGWVAIRSFMLALMWVAYYLALPQVALSVAAAVWYTLPLFITLFAALFVGEQVRIQGWLAVVLGFFGVLLIAKPQSEDFNAYALLPLISAILYAGAMILTRTKSRKESPLILALALHVAFIGVGAIASFAITVWEPSSAQVKTYGFLLGQWTPMGSREWLAMGLLAASALIGSVFAAIAYQAGPSSTVSTFDFSYLAFAVFWGIIFFAEVPDAITCTGVILIATAGILTVRR